MSYASANLTSSSLVSLFVPVIPAEAGIDFALHWMPAFAGMTSLGVRLVPASDRRNESHAPVIRNLCVSEHSHARCRVLHEPRQPGTQRRRHEERCRFTEHLLTLRRVGDAFLETIRQTWFER